MTDGHQGHGHHGSKEHGSALPKKAYEHELRRLQEELAKLEEWVQRTGQRIVSWISDARTWTPGKGSPSDRTEACQRSEVVPVAVKGVRGSRSRP